MIKKPALAAVCAIGLVMGIVIGAPAVAAVSPATIDGATTIDAATAKQFFDRGVIFVDVRKNSDWEAGRVPGAVHLELNNVLSDGELAKVAPKDGDLVFYCNGEKCMRSSRASAMAVAWGFSKVYYFRDGFPAWQASGYPVE